MVSAPAFGSPTPYATGSTTYMEHDANGFADLGTFHDPGAPKPPGSVSFTNNAVSGFVYHMGVPDLAQVNSQCVPTSAADSLLWMNATYHLGITDSPVGLVNTLAVFMHTGPD